jgi:pyruvate/2-oxoglutarate dehydrogenase complex dihydrolipoamide acyltransferase (E2) component
MATAFTLPDLGENIDSGDVVSVLVAPGDTVKPGQAVLEVETDKAVIEVPCPPGGVVKEVLVKKGETVAVGQKLLSLEAAGAAAAAPPASAAATAPPAEKPAAARPAAAPAPQPVVVAEPVSVVEPAPAVESNGRAAVEGGHQAAAEPAGPAVRRLARELGVDLARVTGSGPSGRIVREDVVAAVRRAGGGGTAVQQVGAGGGERDEWGPIHREQMSRMRKTIAANMVRSVSTIPHLTNFDDADVTELERLRKESAAEYAKTDVKLTALAFVVKAVSLSLRQHPVVNASVDMEKGELIYKDYVNVGLAVDTPRGLVVPVLRDCDRQRFRTLPKKLPKLLKKRRIHNMVLKTSVAGPSPSVILAPSEEAIRRRSSTGPRWPFC